jgi:thioredoxin-related protein
MSQDGVSKKLEMAAFAAIIILCAVSVTVLVKRFVLAPNARTTHSIKPVTIGSQVALNHDWSQSRKTLVLVLSETCHFCDESAPFYRALTDKFSDRQKVRFVAALPQDVTSATKHLHNLGVSFDEVDQSELKSLGVEATPTLILVSNSGKVIDSWLGQLSPQDESKVIEKLEAEL